jgi:hypothetical protein
VKIIKTETLLSKGPFSSSDDWRQIQQEIRDPMAKVIWPVDSDKFTIYPTGRQETRRGQRSGADQAGAHLSLLIGSWKAS